MFQPAHPLEIVVLKRNRALKPDRAVSEELYSDKHSSVDNYYYIRSSELSFGTPLGFSVDVPPDKAVEKLIGGHQELHIPRKTRSLRLKIAIAMRGGFKMEQFTFWPTHILHQSGQSHPCMVIQQKAFSVQGKKNVVEINLDHYKYAVDQTMVLVHELAFGPAAKPGVIPPCLIFQLSEEDLVVCPPEVAKRYVDSLRGRSQPPLLLEHRLGTMLEQSFPGLHYPFFHMKPNDKDAFSLVTKAMLFQLCKLQMEEEDDECEGIFKVEQYDKKANIAVGELALKAEYHKFINYCNTFLMVPRTKDFKEPTTLEEIVPSNSCNYNVEDDTDGHTSSYVAKRYTKAVIDLQRNIGEDSPEDECNGDRRLPVFRRLTKND